jgi:hypothetical protein
LTGVSQVRVTQEELDQFWEEFNRYGLGVSGHFMVEAMAPGGTTAEHFVQFKPKWQRKKVLGVSYVKAQKFLEKADEVFQAREATLRFTKYVADRKRGDGMTPEEAQYEKKALIRYDFSAPGDQLLRSTIMPFWMFRKGTLMSFYHALLNNKALALMVFGLPQVGAFLWNNLFFPDEEDKLQNDKRSSKKYIARQFHLFTGLKSFTGSYDDAGNPIMADVLLFDQLPSDELMRMVGVMDMMEAARQYRMGMIGAGELAFRLPASLMTGPAMSLWEIFGGPLKTALEIPINLNLFYNVPIWRDRDPWPTATSAKHGSEREYAGRFVLFQDFANDSRHPTRDWNAYDLGGCER